ncbi:MAG: tetratricopeptide repeat protein [Clostridium sp.]|nr:tetratricopeptide repeat protein [Clostridium sp.]
MKKQTKLIIGITVGVLLAAVIAIAAVRMTFGGDSRNCAKHMELAEQYIERLEYEQAIAEYQAAIEIDPNHIEAHRALAELYVQTGDYETAIMVLNQGLERTGSEELAEYAEEVRLAWEAYKAGESAAQDGAGQEQEEADQKNAEENAAKEEIFYNDDGSYLIVEYSEDGNLDRSHWYDAEGMLNGCYVYEYGEDGNLKKVTTYDAEGEIDSYTVYEEYDRNGNCLKYADYDADGTLQSYRICECDESGNLVKSTEYGADGTILWVDEYDKDGNLLVQEDAAGNGAREERVDDLNGYGYWIEEYDENGKQVKVSWYSTEENEFAQAGEWNSYVIVEEEGNCKKFTRYTADGILDWYAVEEYDGRGSCVKITCYSAEGAVQWVEECGGEVAKIFGSGARWRYGEIYEFTVYDANGERLRRGTHSADYTEVSYDVIYESNGHYVDVAGYRGDGTISWEEEVDEDGNRLNVIFYRVDGSIESISPLSN